MATLLSAANEPLAALAPMPHRKLLRSWLAPISERSTAYALWLVGVDVLLFIAGLVLTVRASHPALQVLAGLATGFVSGRLVFLPSMTPYSLWDVGHNTVHHGYTNLKGFDFVWEPHTLEEFQALPAPPLTCCRGTSGASPKT